MQQSSLTTLPATLSSAADLAAKGQFAPMVAVCQKIIDAAPGDKKILCDVGNLLLNTGHLSYAQQCFDQILKFSATDLIGLSGLANIAQAQGQHHKARELYEQLEFLYPNNALIKRNALLQLEYDPNASDQARFEKALAWGNWVTGGKLPPRPPLADPNNRLLNIGYVSSDLCMHTVGLMVRNVITQHNQNRFKIFTYHAGKQVDWVTKIFEQKTHYRYCQPWSDAELAQCIQRDQIDILVDLSGHTAGSRLSVFALRPAPIQVSWLGYFATTGLRTIDAVLLDELSTTPSTQNYFCEQILKLPSRFCFSPVPFAPDVTHPPHKKNGHITFGSFNNTAKLNKDVIQVWARILHQVPKSRLILKWRTFNDKNYRESLFKQFADLGVHQNRLELRGPSFHADMLREYADIDIALDPFPFTGGQTTCDALMMGVPVITLAQERTVSRQSASILSSCGLDHLITYDEQTHTEVASSLACDVNQLESLRQKLRQKITNSPLCDSKSFCSAIERLFIDLSRFI